MSAELTVHWPYLLLAVVLLWFPRQWLRLGKRVFARRRRHKDGLEQFAESRARDPEDKSVRLGIELRSKRNWMDLARAAVGSVCLMEFSFASAEAAEGAQHAVLALQVFVALIGTLVQCIRREEKVSYFAPIFYLVGVGAGLGAPYPALFSLLLVLAINPVLPNPRVFLSVFGLLMLPFGLLFREDFVRVGAAAALVCVPPLISVLAARPLVIYSKRAKPA